MGSIWTRRHLIGAGAAAAALSANPALAALDPTPRQTTGPFYPRRLPLDHDSDLVQVDGRLAPAQGTVTHLFGRVLAPDGSPVQGARVEIWQCDAMGSYHHPRDGGGADPNFQGFGRTRSSTDGGFRFRTIRPVPYPGRTPHIHVLVEAPGGGTLTTQLYVEGEPGNANDFLYRRLSPDAQRAVTLPFRPADDLEPGALTATAQIVLGGAA